MRPTELRRKTFQENGEKSELLRRKELDLPTKKAQWRRERRSVSAMMFRTSTDTENTWPCACFVEAVPSRLAPPKCPASYLLPPAVNTVVSTTQVCLGMAGKKGGQLSTPFDKKRVCACACVYVYIHTHTHALVCSQSQVSERLFSLRCAALRASSTRCILCSCQIIYRKFIISHRAGL